LLLLLLYVDYWILLLSMMIRSRGLCHD
jgi:hypothetical protein